MSTSEIVDLALGLWPQARDQGRIDDPTNLDRLLGTQAQPGAAGFEGGVRGTFACAAPGEDLVVSLPTGESLGGDDARLLGNLLVTRTLLAAGLHVDQRVQQAMGDAYAMTWCVRGGYDAPPIVLATSIWLIALDPLRKSDRPLNIDWSPELYQDASRWDTEYRFFSHYDVRERALDWVVYASVARDRHAGCSMWSIVEPLLRLNDDRAYQALAGFAEASDTATERVAAAAMLERGRIEGLLRAFTAQQRQRRATGRE